MEFLNLSFMYSRERVFYSRESVYYENTVLYWTRFILKCKKCIINESRMRKCTSRILIVKDNHEEIKGMPDRVKIERYIAREKSCNGFALQEYIIEERRIEDYILRARISRTSWKFLSLMRSHLKLHQ